jgi:hypothetical protein
MEYINNNSFGELNYKNSIIKNKEYDSLFSDLNKKKFKLITFKIFCIINDCKKINKRYVNSDIENNCVFPNTKEFKVLCSLFNLPIRRNHISFEKKISYVFDNLNINQKICILNNIKKNIEIDSNIVSDDIEKSQYITDNYMIHDYYKNSENVDDFVSFVFSKLSHPSGSVYNLNDMINEKIKLEPYQIKSIIDIINNNDNNKKQYSILNILTNKQLDFLGI